MRLPMTRRDSFTLLTAEQLAADSPYRECELWDGIPVVKGPSDGRSPYVGAALIGLLCGHVAERALGWVGGPDSGYVVRRAPDRVLSPDVAFVSFARMPEPPAQGFPGCVPDFVAEVRSPGDSWREVLEKCLIWTSHGVPVVWLVDPIEERILVLRPGAVPQEVRSGETADAAPALPDFTVAADDLFRRPARR